MTAEVGRVLVVDDNRLSRMRLAHDLEREGHVVAMAEDGPTALAMLAAEPVDVVLLDIVMPGMDGYEVLQRIKDDARLHEIPVIVISAVDELDSAVRCIEMGAEDYLPKPFPPVLLRARLNASLQKKRLRDLERAYLEQEMMLRQTEKLATLGRMTAGLAHELNNPAAAVRRGAGQLGAALEALASAERRLTERGVRAARPDALDRLERAARSGAARPPAAAAELDPLARGDREAELEASLEALGVEEAWAAAPCLVELGFDAERLADAARDFSPEEMPAVLDWIGAVSRAYGLVEEVGLAAARMADLVAALKGYSYLDRGDVQSVDIAKGLDDTLVLLRGELKDGITLRRDYAPDLPSILGRGGELNQVWTNLIDNAIDALGGRGEVVLRTRLEDGWIVVDIEDDGPGISPDVSGRVFDPFFTTKPPGDGVGLGLSVSHTIVTQRHGGTIAVDSQPGRTRFRVRLPLVPPDAAA